MPIDEGLADAKVLGPASERVEAAGVLRTRCRVLNSFSGCSTDVVANDLARLNAAVRELACPEELEPPSCTHWTNDCRAADLLLAALEGLRLSLPLSTSMPRFFSKPFQSMLVVSGIRLTDAISSASTGLSKEVLGMEGGILRWRMDATFEEMGCTRGVPVKVGVQLKELTMDVLRTHLISALVASDEVCSQSSHSHSIDLNK